MLKFPCCSIIESNELRLQYFKKVIKSNADCSVVVTFENNVQCSNNDGNMKFGHITVDTRPEEDDEDVEDDWYEEDEDDDY